MKAVRPCSATVISLTLVLVVALSSAQQDTPGSRDAQNSLCRVPTQLTPVPVEPPTALR
jgi:hypothetical protein